MTTDPTRLFPGFYDNQTVRDVLAPQARWTVSDSRKMPVDMRALLADGQVRGARQHDESCLVTLDELTSGLPGATNCAYWLDASLDGVVVIDIERTCPPEVSAPILELGSLYSEVSMSSLGYHLLMPLPASFYDMPAGSRSVLRAEHGYWEVLQRLCQRVTVYETRQTVWTRAPGTPCGGPWLRLTEPRHRSARLPWRQMSPRASRSSGPLPRR